MSTRILSRLQPPDTSYWAIIKLSLPVWISNVAIVGGATLDTLMTGHLGSTDLAAVAIGERSRKVGGDRHFLEYT